MYRTILLYLVFWIFSLTSFSGFAQECIHTNLSRHFDFKINILRNSDTSGYTHGAKIDLLIYNKQKALHQKVSLECQFLFDDAYGQCDKVRSYVTGQNVNKEALDNDYGDLIVADLNFDGKEDFAIKDDSGGNGGPFYKFYIQQKDHSFKEDNFLSEKVGHFPAEMYPDLKTIVTHVHANVREHGESTYHYNSKLKKWRRTKHIYVRD